MDKPSLEESIDELERRCDKNYFETGAHGFERIYQRLNGCEDIIRTLMIKVGMLEEKIKLMEQK